MLFKIAGFMVLVAVISVIALLYHIATQTLWHDIYSQDFEWRVEREVELRMQSAEIKIHKNLVIVDETEKKE